MKVTGDLDRGLGDVDAPLDEIEALSLIGWKDVLVRVVSVAALTLALLGAGCSAHSTAQRSIGPSKATTSISVRTHTVAAGPSADERFVCSKQAASALAFVLGGRSVKVVNPVWSNGEYSCEYKYVKDATVTMSVKEFATWPKAIRYFDQRHRNLRNIDVGADCHDDCYVTSDGLALIRSGPQVLFADASRLPSRAAGLSRADNAVAVVGAATPP